MSKARGWTLYVRHGRVFTDPSMNAEAVPVREILPSDKTPEQVIQAVCEFLRSESSKWDDVGSGIYFAALVEAKKERILE